MKLSEYAAAHGIKYRAAWNRYKAGKIPGAYEENGHIVIPDPPHPHVLPQAAIYARVSTPGQREDLERQSARLRAFATANGYPITHNVQEIASGVNDHRPKLTRLLTQPDWNILIIEHKDRLTRVGYNWINILLTQQNRYIIVTDQATDDTQDLLEDFTSIIYSFCARLYGQRGHKNKAKNIINNLPTKGDNDA